MIPFYYDDFSTVDPESDDVKEIEQDMLAGTDIHGTSACPSPPEQDLEEEEKQLAKGQAPDTTSSELTALLLCIICSDELNLSRAYVLCESKHAMQQLLRSVRVDGSGQGPADQHARC